MMLHCERSVRIVDDEHLLRMALENLLECIDKFGDPSACMELCFEVSQEYGEKWQTIYAKALRFAIDRLFN